MRKNQFRAFAGVAALSLCLGLGAAAMPMGASAATEHWNDASASQTRSWENYKKKWDTIKSDWENVSLTPGENETELNFAWYSRTDQAPQVRIATNQSMRNARLFSGEQEEITSSLKSIFDSDRYDYNDNYIGENDHWYSNKVTVDGLEENTTYYYQVCQNGVWQNVETYKTNSFSDFSFLYVGDPQIGASSGQTNAEGEGMNQDNGIELAARNDSYNWNQVLNKAMKENPDVSFMVSAGDQVNTNNNEAQYAGYLGANALKSLPVATTIGNHDSGSPQYSYHYNNPNTQENAGDDYTAGKTAAGTDYYYTYGNVLFIILDTNNYNCATHENVIKKAVEENQDAKWRVVMFHQDIYGSGADHSDSDGMVLRTQITPLMDKYDIDVVLQGHDHTYSRTYQLTGDGQEHAAYDNSNWSGDENYQSENLCYELKSDVKGGTITNPEGTVYYEANSATGSKFYELIPTQQDYIAERSQTWTPTYSVISVTDDSFSVTTYDATTQERVEGSSTYTIVKTDNQQEEPQQPADDNNNTNTDTNTGSDNNANVNNGAQNTQTPAAATATVSKVKGVKATNKAGNKVKVKWNTVNGADGYQIQYTYKKGFKKKVKTVNVNKASKSSKVLKKMKVGKKVYVKVRAYQNVNGQKVFGNFSKVKKLNVR
ncbi:metallophosphoesterase family protein [Eubacterium sp. An3]|uniref:purple acid phosphatase family protein n=1 Tax=Eubacterium sp. An3 TaxID=1965628 RepID=UPI000B36ABB2|nr:metallophosphoesterase family protein [Eubacterium sp. An3]OUO26781.1 hypothetical protein B5F87_12715 [Eubacterium sp. An3]